MRTTTVCCLLVLALATAPLPGQNEPSLEIKLDAASSDIDRLNNRLVFYDVQISQGDVGIRADVANGASLEFENTEWVLRGQVRITSPEAVIDANEATLVFAGHKLRHALVTGAPVAFEHRRPDAPAPTHGQASQVDYDFDAQVLRLSGNAWLSEGKNQITGDSILYDIAGQRVLAGSGPRGSDRVRVTITPPADTVKDMSEQAPSKPLPRPLEP